MYHYPKTAFAAILFIAATASAIASTAKNQAYATTVTVDGHVLVGITPPTISAGGPAFVGTTRDVGYAQCIPGGLRAANVRVGWQVQTDVLASGAVRVTGWARVITDPKILTSKACIKGDIPTRVAHWDFTTPLAAGQSIVKTTASGFTLRVQRLADLATATN